MTDSEYKQSRLLFIFEGCTGFGIFTLSSGVIISGIMKYMGAQDALNGIISGLPVGAGILLIFMPLVFRNLTRVKKAVVSLGVIHRLLYTLMLSVPLIISDNTARLTIFIIIYATAYLLGTFIGPSSANWLVSLVPGSIRGRYMGLREGAMIATMTVFSVFIGITIDHMKAAGHEALGYGVCSAVVFVLTVINFIMLLKIKEPPPVISEKKITFKTTFTNPIKNKDFRKVLLLTAFWSFSLQIGGPYFSIYFYSVMGLNYAYIMIMNVLANVLRVAAAQVWGRLADSKSWAYVTKLSFFCLGIVHIGFAMMNLGNYQWLYPLLQLGVGIGWGGIGISMFNLQFEYAPQENRASYVSLNNAVGSIVGFSAVLIASAIVGKIGGNLYHAAFIPIHGMQFLFLASGVFIMLTSLYVHQFVKD